MAPAKRADYLKTAIANLDELAETVYNDGDDDSDDDDDDETGGGEDEAF